ncbi:hypothetical protein HanRHA438_Chr16g0785991 [Helianthus annuus]|nr:hypothetical protein HanRHA438_Chr16g0785991 [Helianthus annuus]
MPTVVNQLKENLNIGNANMENPIDQEVRGAGVWLSSTAKSPDVTSNTGRGVQKIPNPKPNPKYPKTRIRNIRNFGYPNFRISENRIIQSFGFGCEF